MKCSLAFIFLLLLSLGCRSQHVIVSATKMNVLYVGVENPVSFAAEHTRCSELVLAIENGTATRTGDCDYNVVVTKPGNTTIFILKGTDTLSKTLYRVRGFPDPSTKYRGNGPYWLLLDSLRMETGLVPVLDDNFNFDARFTMVSYEVTVFRSKKIGGEKKVYCSDCLEKIEKEGYETVFYTVNEGEAFNDLLKDFIKNKLMPGDKVFIEEIKARGPDGKIRTLSSIAFSVQ